MADWSGALLDRLGAGFAPETPPPYDLRQLYRNVGHLPTELVELPARRQVRLTGHLGGPVTASPAEVFGAIDGIQPPARALAWRSGRPVGFLYVAAGCVAMDTGRPAAHEERLLIVASDLDEAWARSVAAGVPVVTLDQRLPAELVTAINDLHRSLRHRLERDVLAQVRHPDRIIVVDGALHDLPSGGPVAGVVKSHAAQYLTDESEITALPARHLSTVFELPAATAADTPRWSAYLRLQPAADLEWTHGLVRIEADRPDLLGPVAAWALINRQPPGPDRRWAVHLAPIADCEHSLRSRVPPVM